MIFSDSIISTFVDFRDYPFSTYAKFRSDNFAEYFAYALHGRSLNPETILY